MLRARCANTRRRVRFFTILRTKVHISLQRREHFALRDGLFDRYSSKCVSGTGNNNRLDDAEC
jgi:hypothetical protein